MKKYQYKIGEEVIINCKNFVPSNCLDSNGWFAVKGVITGFTAKRIKVRNFVRETESFYSPNNVRRLK